MNRHFKEFALAAAFCLMAIRMASGQEATSRPEDWALKISVPGAANFYQVTSNLYRGAQPTADGMAHLEALGIRSVINLRMMRSDRSELRGTHLKSVNFGMVPWHVSQGQVVGFLKAATDTNNLPVFVHCEHGADRTGVMCAIYRVAVCGWTKEEAIAEMRNGGFAFGGTWQNLVRYVERADIAELQRRAGLPQTIRAGNENGGRHLKPSSTLKS